uniref:PNPLA domain-containing protein n=1 Tax=Zooxanthella nutricula TaxID=1333877 RepID=A0A7S2PMW4_9DINO
MISSVSGGSWASSILMFADMDLQTLLGPATDPSRLTLAELDRRPPPLGAVVMTAVNDIAISLKMDGVPFGLLWVATIAQAFLEPFGLDRLDAFMAGSRQAEQQIKAQNPQYRDEKFYVPQPGRAKNIVMGSTVEAPDGYKATSDNAVYLQVSPDFSGSAFYPNNVPVSYTSTDPRSAKLTRVLLGGGLVSTFAFGGSAPSNRGAQQGGKGVEMHAPARPFCLARSVGMSSAAFGAQISNLPGLGGHINPQVDMFPVTSLAHPRPQKAKRYMIGDGGNLENTGLLAMLQRGATRIVSLINGPEPFITTMDYCNAPGYVPTGKELTSQFGNLFGYGNTADDTEFHMHNQVFPSSEYLPALCDLYKLRGAGKSLTIRRQLTVVRNDWWGITGGSTVDIVFVILGKALAFEGLLPPDTAQALEQPLTSGLNNFPLFKTMFNNPPDLTQYTARQINLLSAQTEWAIRENADMIRAVLR